MRLLAVFLLLISRSAFATDLILDSTNNYTVTHEGITISQPAYNFGSGRGFITFGNAVAAVGDSSSVDFLGQTFTQIGNGVRPVLPPSATGLTQNVTGLPQNFVFFDVPFILRRDSDHTLFEAEITYYNAPQGNAEVGPPPVPNNNAGLVVNITPVALPISYELFANAAGLSGADAAFTADPFENGIPNGIAYALGIPQKGSVTLGQRSKLPSFEQPAGYSFIRAEPQAEDIVLRIWKSVSLSGGTHSVQVAQKTGSGNWTGSIVPTEQSSASGVEVTLAVQPSPSEPRAFFNITVTRLLPN
ncbi:MAG: hypothetical protein AAGA58_12815 [Verrucomicrobiota bacterium]